MFWACREGCRRELGEQLLAEWRAVTSSGRDRGPGPGCLTSELLSRPSRDGAGTRRGEPGCSLLSHRRRSLASGALHAHLPPAQQGFIVAAARQPSLHPDPSIGHGAVLLRRPPSARRICDKTPRLALISLPVASTGGKSGPGGFSPNATRRAVLNKRADSTSWCIADGLNRSSLGVASAHDGGRRGTREGHSGRHLLLSLQPVSQFAP